MVCGGEEFWEWEGVELGNWGNAIGPLGKSGLCRKSMSPAGRKEEVRWGKHARSLRAGFCWRKSLGFL